MPRFVAPALGYLPVKKHIFEMITRRVRLGQSKTRSDTNKYVPYILLLSGVSQYFICLIIGTFERKGGGRKN